MTKEVNDVKTWKADFEEEKQVDFISIVAGDESLQNAKVFIEDK